MYSAALFPAKILETKKKLEILKFGWIPTQVKTKEGSRNSTVGRDRFQLGFRDGEGFRNTTVHREMYGNGFLFGFLVGDGEGFRNSAGKYMKIGSSLGFWLETEKGLGTQQGSI